MAHSVEGTRRKCGCSRLLVGWILVQLQIILLLVPVTGYFKLYKSWLYLCQKKVTKIFLHHSLSHSCCYKVKLSKTIVYGRIILPVAGGRRAHIKLPSLPPAVAAAPEDGQREPFSPYVFLDLPPTPRDDGDDDPPLPDDLVLPYISRMLMEEDMDDRFFYQYPDHPALLQAQQPFADILSDADAATATATSSGSGSDSTDANGSGTAFTPSSYVDVVPAFASATWPYDPLELTQRLTAGAANSASSSLPGLEQAGSQFHESTDRGSQSHVQNRVSMDMINQAFLKGMEEANKFLPATSISSSSRGRRKNRGHDDLEEGETGRKSKLMAPEPEETGEIWSTRWSSTGTTCV
ncbi:unnamed protein product [Miscanthus lutarioriparius]|uniref:Uncharacterized protein n=1 Tax=Miscanthus lutarioriparius TaxID=422564 RepID=A0A811QI32_9POAL|nr:unnamed protein product [Miscanthus lutarioriparius]